MRLAGARVQDRETGEYVSPQELTERQVKRTAERLAALRKEVQDRRPTAWSYHRELQSRVDELERRLDALFAAK
jgi:uncharacterized protein YlxW (UPF0749 family)